MINPGLQDTVVLITGVNSPYGIGAATARAFAAQGAAVVGTYLPTDSNIAPTTVDLTTMGEEFYRITQAMHPTATVERIRAQQGRIEVVAADLADIQAIPALFDYAEATFGPVNVLVNNAAHCVQDTFIPAEILHHAAAVDGFPMQTTNAAIIDQHFAVNSRAVALLIAEFARRHVSRQATWGRIVSVSTDGAAGFASEVSYGASKSALESYNRAAATELGPFGITVNIVSPGPIQTGWITPAMEADIARTTPLRRVGQPDDVADAIVMLASEQARWLTGQCVYVGGGHHMG